MIQAMRMRPKTVPCAPAAATMATGIRKTTSAMAKATTNPASAATQTRVLNTMSDTNSEITGRAETAVESCQAPSGS